MTHPADRIRAHTWLVLAGLALLARDVWKFHGWAGQARRIEQEVRRAGASRENDLLDQHLARVSELQAEIDRLVADKS